MNYLLSGSIIAVVISTWGYIKEFFTRIRSLLIVTIYIDRDILAAIRGYVLEEFKQFKFGDRAFTSYNLFIRSLNRSGTVAVENILYSSIFFKGWKPFFIDSITTNQYTGKTEKDQSITGDGLKISFIRGTFDIEKILLAATQRWDKIEIGETNGTNRFHVKNIIGTLGTNNDKEEGDAGPNTKQKTLSKNFYRSNKIIGYDINDLGLKIHNDSPTNYLAFPQNVKAEINEIGRWLKSKEWYNEKKIPWKRGWLLYGIPGTGKTSLVRALGEYFDLPVVIFSLSTFTDSGFIYAWQSAISCAPCIALFEDMDTVFHGRTNLMEGNVMGSKPLGFNTLLNAIDGVEYADGVFVIVTTNHPEKLDPALGRVENDVHQTRPGRIDKIIHLDILDEECRRQLASRILSDCPHEIERCVKEGDGETGAKFQERCAMIALNNFWDSKEKKNV
jgi:hypothetical protein